MEAEKLFTLIERVLFYILGKAEPIVKKWVREVLKETPLCPESSLALNENLDINQAIDFLSDNGYPTTKGNIYKMTSQNEIPCSRLGKRLIFSRSKLRDWIDSRSVSKSSDIEKTISSVAKSARGHHLSPKINKRMQS